jgi:hypothetical protein
MSIRRLFRAALAGAAFSFLLGLPCVAQQRSPDEKLSSSDWSSIRAAYDAGRHQVRAVEGGHRAHNPGQQWTTLFDGRGFTTTPDAGGWSWGLELVRYGWGEDARDVARPRSVTAERGRVAYAWDDKLTEWYVNDWRGLEHGYTVHTRPAHAGGPLALVLAIRGGLVPVLSADGRDVRFVGTSRCELLTYTGLAVVDAEGRSLAARWHASAGKLRLWVDDEHARYPLTIDPIAQQAYLKASNTEAGDQFGVSAVSGDTVVVGAPAEDSNATGVNGDQSDNSAADSGAAYVFVRNGTTWSQQAYLKASNTEAGDSFGISVSVSGDTVVVGAQFEDSNATGVNGDQSDNGANAAGAAYVFVRNGTTWSQQAYLKASNTETRDLFGFSISVSGDTVVVGASLEDSNATGMNGDQSNNSASAAGAAYVFVRNGTTWSQQAYLKASNTGAFDFFGASISVCGDTVVVGAYGEDSNATGVNGNQSNNNAGNAGAAYVLVRNGTTWSQQAYLKASNTGASDRFGTSISISRDTVVVGAPAEDSNATGVNGDQSDNSAADSGAGYVFVRNGTTWSQQAYLKASNTGAADLFGGFGGVSVSGDTAVVGAPAEDSNATGVNGDQSDNSAADSGAAYVFVRNGTTWSQQAYLKASNTEAGDSFGISVSVSGDTVVVGAPAEDSNATGVNGDQSDNGASEAGAAYVFLLPTFGSFVPFGAGCIGSNALAPAHSASVDGGTPERGELIRYRATSAPPNAPAMLFVGFSKTLWNGVPLPLSLGFIGADPSCSILVEGFATLAFATDGTGSGSEDVQVPITLPIGTRIFTQTVHIDLGVPSPLKITVSNGLETVLGG